jgi:hypothetical protein
VPGRHTQEQALSQAFRLTSFGSSHFWARTVAATRECLFIQRLQNSEVPSPAQPR